MDTFKIIALVGAIIVGVVAFVQLKSDWRAKGLDASVTKVLLGLMAIGCVLVFFASINILGYRG
ncbi:MAG: hypothetical protein ACRENA_14235 [Vulcanimicrobiaceae bacterium]